MTGTWIAIGGLSAFATLLIIALLVRSDKIRYRALGLAIVALGVIAAGGIVAGYEAGPAREPARCGR